MSVKKIATNQPEFFKFSDENLNKAKKIIKIYPEEKQASALMPLLYLVQKQNENWIPLVAMKYLAKMLVFPTFGYTKLPHFIQCITFHQ
tara:strand:+ start:87 stop:353 length:267 start_codon:yes stop_codon:yes gene_type:complete